jgi:hypothetical protein
VDARVGVGGAQSAGRCCLLGAQEKETAQND